MHGTALIGKTGVEKGDFHITYGLIGNLFRASTRGSSPGNSGPLSQLYNFIGMASHLSTIVTNILILLYSQIALPLWRRDVDKEVRKHKQEHYEYLDRKGLVSL